MKRLFITTNVEKAILMYSRNGYENEKNKISKDFNHLPIEYTYGSDFKIIVIDDGSKNWEHHKIETDNDFILYHSSSENDVIEVIRNTFNQYHIQNGSHILEEFHDKVYQVIFGEDEDKPNKIFNVLGFTDKQIEDKNILESQLNFLHHCLTPDGLKVEKVTKSEWAKLDEFTNLQAANDGPFGDNYLKALTTLRDKLLAS